MLLPNQACIAKPPMKNSTIIPTTLLNYFIYKSLSVSLFFFFFQAEDGIRDADVTGVQTCALPISKIYAPMSGMVVAQSAKQGQTLNANQSAPTIVQIADLSRMTVKTQVSEADIGRLKVGMPVYFTTLGRDKRWEGTLRQILPTPEVINNVVLYNAEFDVDNPNGELMTQMSAQVFFVNARASDVLVLPVAVAQGQRPQRGAHRVQVLENGKPVEREVRFGLRDRVHVEVREGLRQGEQVVLPLAMASGAPAPAGQRRGPGGPRL